ncbi:hypothetical protein COOONC_23444 [Cooperia oncophora]
MVELRLLLYLVFLCTDFKSICGERHRREPPGINADVQQASNDYPPASYPGPPTPSQYPALAAPWPPPPPPRPLTPYGYPSPPPPPLPPPHYGYPPPPPHYNTYRPPPPPPMAVSTPPTSPRSS